jgi:hypothetical protein
MKHQSKTHRQENRQRFRRVHGEAMRFARSCDLSPQAVAAIKKARSSSGEEWTTVSVEGGDTIVRAQVLAAFVYASEVLGGVAFTHADHEDLDGGRIMILWIEYGTKSETEKERK